jgi:hypothetical protein
MPPFFSPGMYHQNLITEFISGGKMATGKAESLALKQSLLETGKVPKVILFPLIDHTRKKNQR